MNNKWRQKLHLEPPKGWLNDPNGLCYFKGEYHVYFQYAPDSPDGSGLKHWGHYKSKNLLSWQYMGIVLFPDIPEDRDGVYSGSAIEKDGKLYLFYTGNVKEEGDHDYILSGRGANVICVCSQDGHQMSHKTVVLRNQDYPEFCSCHVRDPKIWLENGIYHMVLGARTKEDKGCVLVYQSTDLEKWAYLKSYAMEDFGYMWECPDYFRVNGKEFLGISPQGLPKYETKFQNVYQAGYMYEDHFEEWDYGFDFYAPQTFDAPDGRKIMIGWMGLPDIAYYNPTVDMGWQHCLTIPRVLTEEDGKIKQTPIEEIKQLRKQEIDLQSGAEQVFGLPFDLEGEVGEDFTLKIENGLEVTYRDNLFSLCFTEERLGAGRKCRKLEVSSLHKIRILADTSSLEIYLEEGKYVMSTRFYPESAEVSLQSEGLRGKLYPLKEMQIRTE